MSLKLHLPITRKPKKKLETGDLFTKYHLDPIVSEHDSERQAHSHDSHNDHLEIILDIDSGRWKSWRREKSDGD